MSRSLPVLPETRFTFPPSLAAYGMPVGGQLVPAPLLVIEPDYVYLQGNFGF